MSDRRLIRTWLSKSSNRKLLLPLGLTGFLLLGTARYGFSAHAYFNRQRDYFRLASGWERLFPIAAGKYVVLSFAPLLDRLGALDPVRVEIEPHVSLLLDPRDLVSRSILVDGNWQPGVWRSISATLTTGAVFLDVGAHIGYDTLKAAAKVGDAGRVLAFEPNPNTVQLLRDNIVASRAGNVLVLPIACADTEGFVTLYDSTLAGNSGASSMSRTNADWLGRGTLRAYTVRARPLDDVVDELALTRLDVLKLDVEGAEYQVLRGARRTLGRFHPNLVVEVSAGNLAHMGVTADQLVSLIKELGYAKSRQVDEDDWEWTVR